MSVTEASRHFADVVNRTYYNGDSTTLIRSGEPVAMLVPVGGASVTGRDWVSRWRAFPRLDPLDAEAFESTVNEARNHLSPVKSKWD